MNNMDFGKEINFTIENATGELKLVYTPFTLKLYQNGIELKKRNLLNINGIKFEIANTDGTTQNIKILNNLINGFVVKTDSGKIMLENKLSIKDLLIALIFPVIMGIGSVFAFYINDTVQNVSMGAICVIGIFIIFDTIRRQTSFSKKLSAMLIVSLGCYVVFFLAGMISFSIIDRIFT